MAWRLAWCALVLVLAASAAEVARPRSLARRLTPEGLAPGASLGLPLAAVNLDRQLDSLRRAGPLMLAGRPWRVGLAADAEFQTLYLAVTGRAGTRFEPIPRPRELLGAGHDFRFDRRAAFRVSVKPRWTDPLHASLVRFAPLAGTPGAPAQWQAGSLLDMLERRTSYFREDGQDYYLAYVSDIDPATRRPAATRSLVFFAQRRFRSRLWRLPESDLPAGRPERVMLGPRSLVLLRRADGLLVVYSGA